VKPEIVCKDAAFKHGITEEDIYHAFVTARYDGLVEDGNNKYLLIGFDTKGNPIEILYNEFGDNGKNVFHAMPCRSMFYSLLNG
jgi:hypothetical protein